ncbi:hypothetical protein OAO87_02220 [bacterium]|nr:hypothetical protein [bacterium]
MLDGYNRFPPPEVLPEFRPTLVVARGSDPRARRPAEAAARSAGAPRAPPLQLAYYEALTEVAERLTRLFSLGLGDAADFFEPHLRRHQHTSYLRLNYYAPYTGSDPTQLCISPHKDAGFLTVLAQDVSCHSLQARASSPRRQARLRTAFAAAGGLRGAHTATDVHGSVWAPTLDSGFWAGARPLAARRLGHRRARRRRFHHQHRRHGAGERRPAEATRRSWPG